MEAPRLLIDMRHPQILPRWVRIGDAARKKGTGCGQAIELQQEFGTLIAHGRKLLARNASAHLNRLHYGSPLWTFREPLGRGRAPV